MNIRRIAAAFVATAAMLSTAALSGCRASDNVEPGLDLNVQTVSADAATRQIKVTADGDWSLYLEETPWASLHFFGGPASQKLFGNGSDDVVILEYEENKTVEERVCVLILKAGGLVKTYQFTQIGAEKPVDPTPVVIPDKLTSDPVPQWMELPAFDPASGLYYINHTEYTEVRNYSYAWDPDAMVARWVAYPMGEWAYPSTGRVGRNEEWAYDPKVPAGLQPNLFMGSYKGEDGKWSGYERGHQLPSDHRQHDVKQNKQTFYGVNMIPQEGGFNSGVWLSLESRVRSWSLRVDTLYVVTGCVVEQDAKTVYDGVKGKKVKVPSKCFKALLAYSGATRDMRTSNPGLSGTGYYAAIAFLFDNSPYPKNEDFLNHKMTVDELEKITGFDFFPNLPDEIEKAVESAIDPWWK